MLSLPSLLSCKAQEKNLLTATAFEMGIAQKDAIQLLDVRTKEEYTKGHIKGALLADWNDEAEFARRTNFIDKHKPVYVYCLAGGRSAAAAAKMRKEGFEKVYELKGGINAWNANNKPLEGKTHELQMSMVAFNNAINANKIVLVDFGAAWCPPCKKMLPVLQNLQQQLPHVFSLLKVDGGKDEAIVKAYKVEALPVFILFKNGQQVWRKDGIVEEKELEELIRRQ